MLLLSKSIFLALSAFVCLVSGQSELAKMCGNRDANPGECSYTVEIQYYLAHSHPFLHKCSGAIISPTFVVTSSECVVLGSDHFELKVLAGFTDIKNISTQQEFIVVESWWDPKHNLIFNTNDIGLVRVDRPIIFNTVTSYVRLPKAGSKPKGLAITSGWGWIRKYQNYGLISAEVLQITKIPIIKNEDCLMAMVKYNPRFRMKHLNFRHNFCTGPLRGDSESCSNDSGSPLVQNGVLIGILSVRPYHPLDCHCVTPPVVHVSIAQNLKFITDQVTDLPNYV